MRSECATRKAATDIQIGMHVPKPEDIDYIQDLGVTWSKVGGPNVESIDEFDEAEWAKYDEQIDWITRDLGLELVVDLRTSRQAQAEILLTWRKDNRSATVQDMMIVVAENCARCVDRWGHLVKNWEFWGEYPCPYVSGMGPEGMSDAYPYWLQLVYKAIKQQDPEAIVWNGGYGCDINNAFLLGLIQDGASKSFDVCNWHHYNMNKYFPPKKTERGMIEDYGASLEEQVKFSVDLYDRVFSESRERMTASDMHQPFASTEWGMPVVRDMQTHLPAALRSFVFGTVHAPFDGDAAVFMDAWLDCFARWDFQVLVIHELWDHPTEARHWGQYCGLLFEDGMPKQVYDVVKRWAQKGAAQ